MYECKKKLIETIEKIDNVNILIYLLEFIKIKVFKEKGQD